MLDAAIIDQLREVFSKLEKPVVLRVRQSPHSDQIELNDLLMGLTKASDLIRVEQSDVISDAPYFELVTDGVPNGVSFRGVPGGHG